MVFPHSRPTRGVMSCVWSQPGCPSAAGCGGSPFLQRVQPGLRPWSLLWVGGTWLGSPFHAPSPLFSAELFRPPSIPAASWGPSQPAASVRAFWGGPPFLQRVVSLLSCQRGGVGTGPCPQFQLLSPLFLQQAGPGLGPPFPCPSGGGLSRGGAAGQWGAPSAAPPCVPPAPAAAGRRAPGPPAGWGGRCAAPPAAGSGG